MEAIETYRRLRASGMPAQAALKKARIATDPVLFQLRAAWQAGDRDPVIRHMMYDRLTEMGAYASFALLVE